MPLTIIIGAQWGDEGKGHITDRLAGREAVCAIVDWTAAREAERLLLVTSTGFARAYPLETLRPSIEAPAPFQFDSPLPGVVEMCIRDRFAAALDQLVRADLLAPPGRFVVAQPAVGIDV